MIINVLIIIDCLDKGGLQMLLYDLLNNSDNQKLKFVLLLTGNGNFEEDLRRTTTTTHVYKRWKKIDLGLVNYTRKILRQYEIDIIHVHESISCLHAYFAQIGLKTKLVYSLHGYPDKLIDKLLMQFLANKSAKVLGVSQTVLTNLFPSSKMNEKYHVFYNGIDTKRLASGPGELKKELELNNESILLGMIGNFINDVRDQFTICKILPELFNEHSNIYFVFVGTKSSKYPIYFDRCFNFCKENNILHRVFFLDRRDDIANILNSLDLFVYSSNKDTFGIAVVEAILCGVPVIVNDIPVFRELTQNGKLATLFKSKSIYDLGQKIQDFIANPKPYHEKAVKAKEKAFELYSIEAHFEKLSNLYLSI